MTTMKPTKTESTKQKYMRLATVIEEKARKYYAAQTDEHSIGAAMTPMQIAIWLTKRIRRREISKSTFRQYRAAIIYAFEQLNTEEAWTAIEYLKKTNYKTDVQPIEIDGKIQLKGAAKKLKRIKPQDMEKLTQWFSRPDYKGEWGHLARLWLQCTINTGLRPIEWKTVQIIEGDPPSLVVQNAKNTNGRAHGPTRTIPLVHLNETEIEEVRTLIGNISNLIKKGTPFEKIQEGCRNAIKNANEKCFSRRKRSISLYSARHQFAANAKASGLKKNEIAALMGHASDKTATIHYARKQVGEAKPNMMANPMDVAKVKVSPDTYKHKLTISGQQSKGIQNEENAED